MRKQQLKWYDILILTGILFSQAIYYSTLAWQALQQHTVTLEENISFSSSQNWQALMHQSCLLLLAFAYLYVREFDFSVLWRKIRWHKWVPLQALIIFVIAAGLNDIYYLLTSYGLEAIAYPSPVALFAHVDLSLICFALLNGFYEEIFFLGFCLVVEEKWQIPILIFSLVVRFSFHTYQGMLTALGLGFILGMTMYLLYKKLKPANLLPFFLAHALADVVGLSVLFLLY